MEQREHGEVVEVFRHPQPREVVEVYSRPLPWVAQPKAPEPPKKRRKTGLWIFLGCLAAIILLTAAAIVLALSFKPEEVVDDGPHLWEGWASEEYWDEIYGRTEDETAEIAIPTWPTGLGVTLKVGRQHSGEPLTVQEIYRNVNPSVVSVIARLGSSSSVGTGVIFTEDGYILTNYHVVEGGSECVVLLESGYSYDAKYVAGDAVNDLAILKVEATGLPAAEFGDSDDLVVGDPAYAIGNPLGIELRGTLTDGIISAINRDVWVDDHTMTLLQTTAALNTGNSGGPLINQYGQVVGINVIKMDSSYSNVEGLGFAIPSSYIGRMVNDLLATGEIQPEPLLGISVLLVAEEVEPGVWGLKVDSVSEGSAAEAAGVQAGDYVLSADGESLQTSQDLLRIRRRFYLGDEMPMTIWRSGEQMDVALKLTQAAEN